MSRRTRLRDRSPRAGRPSGDCGELAARAPLPVPRAHPPRPCRPREHRAFCLWTGAPLAFLTFLASSHTVKDAAGRAGFIAAGLASPVVLVYVGLRVNVDHDPAALPAARAGVGRAGRWDWTDVIAFLPAAAAAVFVTASLVVGVTQAADQSLQPSALTAVEAFAGQAASYAAALTALLVLLRLRRGLNLADLGWRLPRALGRAGWLPRRSASSAPSSRSRWRTGWRPSPPRRSPPTHRTPSAPRCATRWGVPRGGHPAGVPASPRSARRPSSAASSTGGCGAACPCFLAVAVSAAVFSAAHLVLVLALPLFAGAPPRPALRVLELDRSPARWCMVSSTSSASWRSWSYDELLSAPRGTTGSGLRRPPGSRR